MPTVVHGWVDTNILIDPMMVYRPVFYIVLQINERHEFLTKLIGSKEEEDRSYRNADAVMKATTTCMIVFSFLEVVIYYVYNYQVSNVNAFMRLPFAVELRELCSL